MSFLYAQRSGGEEPWTEHLATQRQAILDAKKHRFVTVLDVSSLLTPGMSSTEIANLRYSGPFYVDWDGEDIGITLSRFRSFLEKLEEMEVDLRMVRLYATGGRGFHLEMPWGLFIPKPPKGGVQHLAAIYKEMVYELYVDTIDLRVYSGKRGRMWRCPNVLRENGKYKVALTLDEAINMRVEDYAVLCAAERQAPQLLPPVLNQRLAVLYAKAEAKVLAAAKKKKDSSKDVELLARFKGEYPPSLLKIMAGDNPEPGTGFHPIAMQIAITSNELNKKEEEMLALCEGLIANHVSDGSRYNTAAKRRAELLRMFRYTQDNPCYRYSKGAVKKLLPQGMPTPDLDGIPGDAGSITGQGSNGNDDGLLSGVTMMETGVYRRTEEDGAVKISDIAFKDVMLLSDALSKRDLGFEAEVLVNGRDKGRKFILLDTFLSKAHFNRFAVEHMAGVNGNDAHVAAMLLILRDTALNNNNVVYALAREGLDIIQRPETKEDILDFVWVSPKGVETESPVSYKHRGSPTTDGVFKSDLMDADPFQGNEESASVVAALLDVNAGFVVAATVGWMVAAFHRQIYHRIYGQFPLLHLFGQAGAGKTTLMRALLALHYYRREPSMQHASLSTKFGIEATFVSSASIPCVLDEYKPRDMGPLRHSQLRHMLRAAYNCGEFNKGGLSGELGSSWKDVRALAYSAPAVYMGEALETETALLDRTIAVPLQKGNIAGREKIGQLLLDKRSILSSLGRQIVRASFALDLAKFRETADANKRQAERMIQGNNRVAFNVAVIMTGLDFFGQVLTSFFGKRFEPRLNELKATLNDVAHHVATTNMSEASKAMNTLALISRTEDMLSEFGLREGHDYVVDTRRGMLDIKVREVFVKYSGWCRRKGQPILFDNEDAWMHGLGNYAPLKSKTGLGSPLKLTGMEKVYSFSLKGLAEEGVESFSST